MQEPVKREMYFPALTGIRAIAASMVFLHHFNVFKPQIFGLPVNRFVAEFHVGVTIFFVLSGFLICYRYYHLISFRRAWLYRYFVNRAARIYPMYFLLSIVYSLPVICRCDLWKNLHVLLLNLTFLRGFFDQYKFTLVSSGWSLTVEEMFYFLFPVMMVCSRKLRLPLQLFMIVAAGIFLWLIFRDINFHGFMSSLRLIFEFTFFGRCFEFFTGMYLALMIRSGALSVSPSKRQFRTGLGIVYVASCIALLALNSQLNAGKAGFLFFETAINNFMLPPGIALLFYGLIRERSLISGILASKPFDVLGKSSYSFYLIHNGFLFSFLFLDLGLNVPIIFVILQLIAIGLYFFVEHPLNLWLRKRFVKNNPALAGSIFR